MILERSQLGIELFSPTKSTRRGLPRPHLIKAQAHRWGVHIFFFSHHHGQPFSLSSLVSPHPPTRFLVYDPLQITSQDSWGDKNHQVIVWEL